ncbi:MAG: hypothetical protein LBE08_09115, partial [Bifidobacteriaceae bacterium]|nr:hypothetical protein [Bifidobacteriaceae bacterium]
QFYTARDITAFDYAGQQYRPLGFPAAPVKAESLLTPAGRRYRVTTREQTLVDCLGRLALAGGPENALRSVGGFRHVDQGGLLALAEASSASLRARLGWVLQAKAAAWDVADPTLTSIANSLGGGPYFFSPSNRSGERHWVKRWKLYLPAPEPEMISWLNQ